MIRIIFNFQSIGWNYISTRGNGNNYMIWTQKWWVDSHVSLSYIHFRNLWIQITFSAGIHSSFLTLSFEHLYFSLLLLQKDFSTCIIGHDERKKKKWFPRIYIIDQRNSKESLQKVWNSSDIKWVDGMEKGRRKKMSKKIRFFRQRKHSHLQIIFFSHLYLFSYRRIEFIFSG